MRKENSEFKTKFISESGSYLRNADYFAFVELKDYACYCVADGIDTDDKMESAKLAITAVITHFSEDPGMSKGKIRQYLQIAHNTLLSEAREIRLEASIAIIVTDYKNVRWAHAGNARFVLMRNGRIKYRTKDTSLSQNLADQSEIALDQLETHEERHNLYCYLGQNGHFNPVISSRKKMDDGDIMFLYTRGIWESVQDAELLDAVEGASEPDVVCTNLEDVVLSQQNGILENYTIASVFVNKVYRNPKASKTKKILKIVFSIVMVLAVLIGTILFARYRINKKNSKQMLKFEERGIGYLNENNYTSADEQFDSAIELADKINASEKSDVYKHAKKVEIYDAISGYLTDGMTCLSEGEYKKAGSQFGSAFDKTETLKNDFSEQVDFEDAITVYQNFANAMRDGQEAFDASNYDAAAKSFQIASDAANSIDDTTNRNIADEMVKQSNGRNAMIDGDNYQSAGENQEKMGMLSQAMTEYNAAKAAYDDAKTLYNVEDADAKSQALAIKIDRLNEKIEKQTTQDQEAEAAKYVDEAKEAKKDGDMEKAAELYGMANDIYLQTGNTAMQIEVQKKIDEAEDAPAENEVTQAEALQFVLDAISYISAYDTESAIDELRSAQLAYTSLDETEAAKAIANTISTLKDQQMNMTVHFDENSGEVTGADNQQGQ